MNWLRVVIDGIMMSAYFNLAAGMLLCIDPVIFTADYPKELQKIAGENPHAAKHKCLFSFLVLLPIFSYGIISAYLSGIAGFWPLFWTAYIEWFLVNMGDFWGLDFYLKEKLGSKFALPGTEGHPIYERKNWMKTIGIPEHYILWPFVICPVAAFFAAGIGMLIGKF